MGINKYIIRNCPCYSPKYEYCLGRATKYCKDAIYCPIKQIVEKCRAAQKEYPKKFSDGEMDMFVSGRNNLAGIILALLDIQAVLK